MKTLNKLMNMVICAIIIIVIGFLSGFLFGATNTEQRYGGNATVSSVVSSIAKDVCNNAAGIDRLQAEVDVLNLRLEQYQAENERLSRLLQQEKEKGVMSKMGDNLSAAADSVTAAWKDITD